MSEQNKEMGKSKQWSFTEAKECLRRDSTTVECFEKPRKIRTKKCLKNSGQQRPSVILQEQLTEVGKIQIGMGCGSKWRMMKWRQQDYPKLSLNQRK